MTDESKDAKISIWNCIVAGFVGFMVFLFAGLFLCAISGEASVNLGWMIIPGPACGVLVYRHYWAENHGKGSTSLFPVGVLIAASLLIVFVQIATYQPSTSSSSSTSTSSSSSVAESSTTTSSSSSSSINAISWQDAHEYIGYVETVQGVVKSVRTRDTKTGTATFINIGADYPDKRRVTAVIWSDARDSFKGTRYLSDSLVGTTICVAGRLEKYEGAVEIELNTPAQIKLIG